MPSAFTASSAPILTQRTSHSPLLPTLRSRQQLNNSTGGGPAEKSNRVGVQLTREMTDLHPPVPKQLSGRRVVLCGDTLVIRDAVLREPVQQVLVASRSHHLDLLVRPRVHRDRSHEAAEHDTSTNAPQARQTRELEILPSAPMV